MSHSIVDRAVQLWMRSPHLPAQAILDEAMQGHEGSDPQLDSRDPISGAIPHPAYSDDTDPPSPFADLIRRAFAPDLDPREWLLLAAPELPTSDEGRQRIDAIRERWQEALEAYAQRYRIWGG